MVCIVQCIEQVFVERMNVLQSGKAVEYGLEFLGERLGGEFDLSSVEACIMLAFDMHLQMSCLTSYPGDLEAGSNLCRELSLSPRKYDVDELL